MTEGPVRGEPIEERPDIPLAPDELRVELAEELAGDLGTDPVADASIETMAGGTNARASVMRSSLLMGTGTVLSRFGGVLRGIFLAAALGAGTVADMFNLGNTLPNVVYILVIGGALNAVFIPELVRHMKSDDDDGQGYANSLITLVGSILLAVSLAAVVIAPWIVRIYATPQYTQSQLDLATAFARFCLPQIFFYGVYTMLSQVLNARGHFGTPMFAPIVNNIVAIATFVMFIIVSTSAQVQGGTLTSGQVTLLGVGTTLGVAAQAFVLIPVLRRAQYSWRPSWKWRGVGLGQAGNLAFWTIMLVLVNQLAYIVIVRLATGVNATSADTGATPAGLTAYTNAHLMFILPHSVITVSIVAALLPRMSRAAHDLAFPDLALDIASGMRSTAALIIPSAVALVVLGTSAGIVLFNYGETSTASAEVTGQLAEVFALALLPFALFYVILRGWYALEATRTAFFVTVALNVVYLAVAVPLFEWAVSRDAGPAALGALAVGYVTAYWFAMTLGWRILSGRLGGLDTRRTVLTLGRMMLAGLGMFAVMLVLQINVRDRIRLDGVSHGAKLAALLDIVVVGLVGVVVYLALASLFRVTEVSSTLAVVRRRLPGGRS